MIMRLTPFDAFLGGMPGVAGALVRNLQNDRSENLSENAFETV
jgi:hypothetical protein